MSSRTKVTCISFDIMRHTHNSKISHLIIKVSYPILLSRKSKHIRYHKKFVNG